MTITSSVTSSTSTSEASGTSYTEFKSGTGTTTTRTSTATSTGASTANLTRTITATPLVLRYTATPNYNPRNSPAPVRTLWFLVIAIWGLIRETNLLRTLVVNKRILTPLTT
jgi:hypothetical protein